MHIVEVKNNLVKISYDTAKEDLMLSGFIVIKDKNQSFIAQILHLESSDEGSFAISKLLFNFDNEGIVSNYNGSIPDYKSFIDIVHSNEILELLPIEQALTIGEIAQQKTILQLDKSFLKNKLLVCAEKEEDNTLLIKNLVQQLQNQGEKVLVFDLDGTFNLQTSKITACREFSLPLNYETIDFIYEKGLDEAKAETKAMIQEIFIEVQEYVKTLKEKFIPFETFKNIVSSQYKETGLIELVLLKNKLLKYFEAGIFAQEKREFHSLKMELKKETPTVFDLSKAEEKIQREIISYAYSVMNEYTDKYNKDIYVFLNVKNSNSDKKLLKQIFASQKIYSILTCSYSFKYLKELKQLAKDLVLFAPIQKQDDFAVYNTFLSKLNPHEFIVYGEATHHLALIVRLDELSNLKDNQPEQKIAPMPEPIVQPEPEVLYQEVLDEQIKKDVDEIYTTTKPVDMQEVLNEELEIQPEFVQEELTEDDLDFIEDMHFSQEEEVPANTPDVVESIEIIENEFDEKQFEEITQDETSNFESITDEMEYNTPIENILQEEESEEEITEETEEPPISDILPVKMSSTPIVPVYSADIEPKTTSDKLIQGDIVVHPKYGRGIVEKLISYGAKTLCSINFDNVGRRLLDPTLAEIKKEGI